MPPAGPLDRAQHDEEAVRRPRRPQGGDRRLRPRRAAPDARRRGVGEIAQHFLPPGIRGFEEAGGEQGFAELDYMENPKGDPALAEKYFERKAAGCESGKYDGGETVTIADEHGPGQETPRSRRPSSRSSASRSTSAWSRRTRCTRSSAVSRRPTCAICPNVGGSRTSTIRSRCSSRRSTARRSCPQATSTGRSSTTRRSTPRWQGDAARDGDERNQAWAEINKMIIEQAAAIPSSGTTASARVEGRQRRHERRLHSLGLLVHVPK